MAKINNDLLMQLESKMVETKVLKLKVNGKPIDITVEKKFLNTKIEKLITELLKLNQYVTEQNLEGFDITTMLFLVMFKTFTDIPYIEKGTLEEKLENYVRVTSALRNLECEDGESIFEKVVKEFGEEQIQKINNKMTLMTKNIGEFVKSEQDKVSEVLIEDDTKVIEDVSEVNGKKILENIVENVLAKAVKKDASI